jgi:NADPH:quinone reductase-like Zn-dependent oxidoreductase
MSFTEAAALPVVFSTVYYALTHIANIQLGETKLIHSATGGTGQAAIQIAKLRNAEIFVTVGSEEKKKLLMELYQIPPERIFDSRNASFAKAIRRVTGGRGVDVVLNSLSGDLLVSSWECIAPFGRFLELGKKDILSNHDLPMRQFERNASFHAIDLNEARKYRPELLQRLQREIGSLMASHTVTPPRPIHVYPISEVEQAFRYLQHGKNTRKTVIEIRGDDPVKVSRKSPLP